MKSTWSSRTAPALVFAIIMVSSNFGCHKKAAAAATPVATAVPAVAPEILKKIGFDVSKIDENGLRGPAGGKVSVAYEFCIPSWQTSWDAVQKIDPTLKFNSGQGRIGCERNFWCVLGSTSGKDWQARLFGIAKLDFVKSVQETVWE